MNLINLTPHDINDVLSGKTIPKLGIVARLKRTYTKVDEVEDIDIFQVTVTKIDGLPAPKKDTIYIVSTQVSLAIPERQDLLSPGERFCNKEGKTTGCKGLIRQRRTK